jgi:manganese-dependent inorganic pyrophosphatase
MKKEILVTGYVNPDLDGVSCIFAYADFLNKTGQKAIPFIFGKHHEEADHVIREYDLKLDTHKIRPEDFEKIVLVDSSDTDGIDKRIEPKKVIEIIDHRKINMAESFPNAKVQIEFVGAAATLIGEKFRKQNIEPSKDIATLLYGAVISNTLNFQAKVTTNRDQKIAGYLKEKYNFSDDFAHKMFLSKSDLSGEKLINSIRGDFANFTSHNFRGKKLGIAQLEMIDGQKLAENRKDEIITEIKKIMKKFNLDIVFLTIIDLEANQNILIAPTKAIEKLLSDVLGVSFQNQIAIRPGLIMRKEIVPLIKEKLENE